MNPDQNPYSIDYLNQIAPAQQKSKLLNKWVVIFGILAVIVGAVVIISLLAKSTSTPTQDLEKLSARMTSLQAITTAAQPNLTANQLRSTNSNLSIFLSNTNRELSEQLVKNGVTPAKISKAVIAAEANTAMTTALEDARLNATYDSVYAREMSLRLVETTSLMSRIYDKSKSKSMREFLQATDTNLQAIRTQFQLATTSSVVN